MDKQKRILGYIIALNVLIISIMSCDDDPLEPYSTNYHMSVDSIAAKDTIHSTEILEITLYYTLYSSCENFAWVETDLESDTLSIKLIGTEQHNVSCADNIVHDYTHLPITGFSSGTYYLEVLQPKGSSLIDSVFVLE
jgi:vesicle coat complex subunit